MPVLHTTSTDYEKVLGTDATDTSFPSRIPTIVEPMKSATRGIIDLRAGGPGMPVQNLLQILPIGTGANDAVLTGMRVIGWRKLPSLVTTTADLWIPVLLAQFAAVFGNVTGVAGGILGATYFFMDTITLTTGNANVSDAIISPTGEIIAHAMVDAKGFPKVELTFDLGANATAANALVARL